ncbi:hypothetical protein NMY22_g6458 [Coprinellus aureogranulatus]|nr:hypothetical protein NMY22_g6458 [Coprinellus aureogranulatus]
MSSRAPKASKHRLESKSTAPRSKSTLPSSRGSLPPLLRARCGLRSETRGLSSSRRSPVPFSPQPSNASALTREKTTQSQDSSCPSLFSDASLDLVEPSADLEKKSRPLEEVIKLLEDVPVRKKLRFATSTQGSAPEGEIFVASRDLESVSLVPSSSTSVSDDRSHSRLTYLYTKHERHWNLDGSLIVQLNDVRYKLHRSRLAQASAWFAEALVNISETRDGVVVQDGNSDLPMLILDGTGISHSSWESLLDATDDAITYGLDPPPLATVYLVLEAAHGLNFPQYKAWAKNALDDFWSDDLEKLHFSIGDQNPIYAVNLGRRCSLLCVVKRAIYELLKHVTFRVASSADFSMDDMLLLTSARSKLQREWIRKTSQFSVAIEDRTCGCADCTSSNAWRGRTAHYSLVILSGFQTKYLDDVIQGFIELTRLPWVEKGFCDECVQAMANDWLKKWERLWTRCDDWFGLKL